MHMDISNYNTPDVKYTRTQSQILVLQVGCRLKIYMLLGTREVILVLVSI